MASKLHFHVQAYFGFCIHFDEEKALQVSDKSGPEIEEWWPKVVAAVYNVMMKNPDLLNKVVQEGAIHELGYEIAAGDGHVLAANTLPDYPADDNDHIEHLFRPYLEADPIADEILIKQDDEWPQVVWEILNAFEYGFLDFNIDVENLTPRPTPKKGLHA